MATYVNSRSTLLQKAYNNRAELRHLRGGTKKMREAGEYYLPKNAGEHETEYQARLRSSVLNNITGRIIDVMTARPFKKPAFINITNEQLKQSTDSDTVKNIQKLNKLNFDFDGKGQTITDFARTLFQEGLWDSQSHVFIDFGKAPVNAAGKPYYDKKQRHKARILNNDSILHARHDFETGELNYFRFIDYFLRPEGYDDVEAQVVWEFEKIGSEVFYTKNIEIPFKDENGKMDTQFVKEIERKKYGLNYIPIISFYPKPTQTPFNPNLIFQGMAELNISHWQSYSEQRNILKTARVPLLFFTGVEGVEEITLGSSKFIGAPDFEANAKYVEPVGNSIESGRKDVLDLEEKMQMLAFELLSKNQSNQSATSASYDMESTNSMLGCFAVSLKETLEQILAVIMDWYNIEMDPNDYEVSMHTNFGIEYNDESIRTLTAAHKNGALSTDGYLKLLKAHGVIPDNFDLEMVKGIAAQNEEF